MKKYMLEGNKIYNASAVVFCRDKAIHISDFEKYRYCGDWFFWCNIMMNTPIVFLNEKLNYFRQHRQKVSPSASINGLKYLEGFDFIPYLLKILCMNHIQSILLAGYYWYQIKRDKNIVSEIIRNKCFTKWEETFQYPVILCILFFQLKKRYKRFAACISYIGERINERGFIGALQYYQRKYIKKYN
jgi:hypothetical protein